MFVYKGVCVFLGGHASVWHPDYFLLIKEMKTSDALEPGSRQSRWGGGGGVTDGGGGGEEGGGGFPLVLVPRGG